MSGYSRGVGAIVLGLGLLSFAVSPAVADTFIVNPNLSVLSFGIEVGLYLEPGDPESYATLATAVGQGTVPGKLPGPVVPGFSDGLSAKVEGTFNVTPAAFSINSAALTLQDSGQWQPGTNIDPDEGEFTFDHLPVSADLGGYLEGYLAAEPPSPPDVTAAALLDDIGLSVVTAAVPLGGGGAFSDPNGSIELNNGVVAVESSLGSFGEVIADPVSVLAAIGGTFIGNVLTLPVGTTLDIEIPTDLITVIARISVTGQIVTAKPGDANFDNFVDGGDYTVWADHFTQTGQTWTTGDFTFDGVVDGGDYTVWADNFAPAAMASAVPEPSSFALLGVGAMLLAWRVRRKLRA